MRRFHSSTCISIPLSEGSSLSDMYNKFNEPSLSNTCRLYPRQNLKKKIHCNRIDENDTCIIKQNKTKVPSLLARHHSSPAIVTTVSVVTKAVVESINSLPSSLSTSPSSSNSTNNPNLLPPRPLMTPISHFAAISASTKSFSSSKPYIFSIQNFRNYVWFRKLLLECEFQNPALEEQLIDYCNLNFGTIHFDILNLHNTYFEPLSSSKSVFYFVSTMMFYILEFGEICSINELRWKQFLLRIEKFYHPSIPFHNSLHAVDVAYSLFCLLYSRQLIDMKESAVNPSEETNLDSNHNITNGCLSETPPLPPHRASSDTDINYYIPPGPPSTKITNEHSESKFPNGTTSQPLLQLQCTIQIPIFYQVLLVIAALLHDAGHFGLTNGFLSLINHKFVSHYMPSLSTLEAMHSDIGIKVLDSAESSLFSSYSAEIQLQMYAFMHECILATDLAQNGKSIHEKNLYEFMKERLFEGTKSAMNDKEKNASATRLSVPRLQFVDVHRSFTELYEKNRTMIFDTYLMPEDHFLYPYLPVKSTIEMQYLQIAKLLIKASDICHCTHEYKSHMIWVHSIAGEMENERLLKKLFGGATVASQQCQKKLLKSILSKNKKKEENMEKLSNGSLSQQPKSHKSHLKSRSITKKRSYEDLDSNEDDDMETQHEKLSCYRKCESICSWIKAASCSLTSCNGDNHAFCSSTESDLPHSDVPVSPSGASVMLLHLWKHLYDASTFSRESICHCLYHSQTSFVYRFVVPLFILIQNLTSTDSGVCNIQVMMQQILLNQRQWTKDSSCPFQEYWHSIK